MEFGFQGTVVGLCETGYRGAGLSLKSTSLTDKSLGSFN